MVGLTELCDLVRVLVDFVAANGVAWFTLLADNLELDFLGDSLFGELVTVPFVVALPLRDLLPLVSDRDGVDESGDDACCA